MPRVGLVAARAESTQRRPADGDLTLPPRPTRVDRPRPAGARRVSTRRTRRGFHGCAVPRRSSSSARQGPRSVHRLRRRPATSFGMGGRKRGRGDRFTRFRLDRCARVRQPFSHTPRDRGEDGAGRYRSNSADARVVRANVVGRRAAPRLEATPFDRRPSRPADPSGRHSPAREPRGPPHRLPGTRGGASRPDRRARLRGRPPPIHGADRPAEPVAPMASRLHGRSASGSVTTPRLRRSRPTARGFASPPTRIGWWLSLVDSISGLNERRLPCFSLLDDRSTLTARPD